MTGNDNYECVNLGPPYYFRGMIDKAKEGEDQTVIVAKDDMGRMKRLTEEDIRAAIEENKEVKEGLKQSLERMENNIQCLYEMLETVRNL